MDLSDSVWRLRAASLQARGREAPIVLIRWRVPRRKSHRNTVWFFANIAQAVAALAVDESMAAAEADWAPCCSRPGDYPGQRRRGLQRRIARGWWMAWAVDGSTMDGRSRMGRSEPRRDGAWVAGLQLSGDAMSSLTDDAPASPLRAPQAISLSRHRRALVLWCNRGANKIQPPSN